MAFAEIGELLHPILQGAQIYGDVYVPQGLQLLSLSLTLTVMWGVFLWWLGEHEGALAKVGRGFIFTLIPLSLLHGDNWISAAGGLAGFFQQELITPLLERSGQQGSGGGAELVKTLITKISNSIWADAENITEKSGWDKTLEFLENPANSMGSVLFGSLTDLFLRMMLTVAGLGLIVVILVALYGPIFALQVGIVIGPLLICWLPFKPLSNLPKNWFRFMLTTGISLVIGVLVVLICSGSIDVFVKSISVVQSSDLPWHMQLIAKFGAFLSALSVMFYSMKMILKSDDIASALIGGATEGSGVGAVVMRSVEKAGDIGGGGGGSPKPEPPKK